MEPALTLNRTVADTAAAREVLLAAPTCWGLVVLGRRPGSWRIDLHGEAVSLSVGAALGRRSVSRHVSFAPERPSWWTAASGTLSLLESGHPSGGTRDRARGRRPLAPRLARAVRLPPPTARRVGSSTCSSITFETTTSWRPRSRCPPATFKRDAADHTPGRSTIDVVPLPDWIRHATEYRQASVPRAIWSRGDSAVDWFERATTLAADTTVGDVAAALRDLDVRVTVIVPARNEAGTVGRIVSAFTRRRPALIEEIIVVDDDSTDDTALQARRAGATVHPTSTLCPRQVPQQRQGRRDVAWGPTGEEISSCSSTPISTG